MRLILAVSFVLAGIFPANLALAQAGCGIPPIPPIPPIGCVRMDPACVCDANGNCRWVFNCVRD